MVDAAPTLVVEGLGFGYADAPDVLVDVSFAVERGERVGLVGPNGAGKSSLFLAIAGVLRLDAGHVRLLGRAVEPGRFDPRVALVFQQAEDQLFCPTVEEDVAFGARNRGLEGTALAARVEEALAIVGLEHLAKRPVHHLSGGEKRLACIAGALAMQPDLVLYDEPSASLDLRNRRRLIGLLRTAAPTVLVAAHDLELILEVCDRVLLLDRGRLVADGPARAVLGDADLMAAHGQEVPHSLIPHGGLAHVHRYGRASG